MLEQTAAEAAQRCYSQEMRGILALNVLVGLIASCNMAGDPPARLDLSGDKAPGLAAVALDDKIFVPFDGNYPAGWPKEVAFPSTARLNHGGKILATDSGVKSLLAVGVLKGNKDQVFDQLLQWINDGGKQVGERKGAIGTHAQLVTLASGQVVALAVYEMLDTKDTCAFQISVQSKQEN